MASPSEEGDRACLGESSTASTTASRKRGALSDDWSGGRLVGFPTTEIDLSDLHPEPVAVSTLATVIWICRNCGFIGAHSVAPERAFG